jgi:hypothetical protein
MKPKSTCRSHPESVTPDIQVENHLSLFLIRPLSERARAWIAGNVQTEAQYFGSALVVEPRYVADLLEGMVAAGLTLVQEGRANA